ncbi:Uncharacterised protein [Legionella sainthelensi]|nr:Uncharacterised protein [Legionella sainthelensi]
MHSRYPVTLFPSKSGRRIDTDANSKEKQFDIQNIVICITNLL